MVTSAQWELVLGNTYAYTVLSAFGFFYGGFGAIITPLFGVTASYGTDTTEYNNALGFFVLSKTRHIQSCRIFSFRWLIVSSVGRVEFLLPARLSPSVGQTLKRKSMEHWTDIHRNLVYIGIFFTVQMAFTLVAASYFAAADGHLSASIGLKKAGGVFAFLSGLLGYYTVGNLMCQQSLFFSFPMGDTSHYFKPKNARSG